MKNSVNRTAPNKEYACARDGSTLLTHNVPYTKKYMRANAHTANSERLVCNNMRAAKPNEEKKKMESTFRISVRYSSENG